MKAYTKRIKIETKGRDDVIDITDEVGSFVSEKKIKSGIITCFVSGSTGSITTIEYEPGLIKDIKGVGERIAPSSISYAHDATWGDGNGYSHLRASVIGPSLTIPIVDSKLTLGTWQQIVVIDHDIRPRTREIVLQIIGE